jgi:hypothetical protein
MRRLHCALVPYARATLIVHSCVFPTIQRDERVLVVWSDNPHSIIPQCLEFEEHLIRLVGTQRHSLMAMDIGPSIPTTPAARRPHLRRRLWPTRRRM